MADYIELFYGETSNSDEPQFRELDFGSVEKFDTVHRDLTATDLQEPGIRIYYRSDNGDGTRELNALGMALVWFWSGRQIPIAVYGDLVVTGYGGGALNTEMRDILTGRVEVFVQLNALGVPGWQRTMPRQRFTSAVLKCFTVYVQMLDSGNNPQQAFDGLAMDIVSG